jgi:hypothetical protein
MKQFLASRIRCDIVVKYLIFVKTQPVVTTSTNTYGLGANTHIKH